VLKRMMPSNTMANDLDAHLAKLVAMSLDELQIAATASF
jgi:hypothetical protein